MYCTNQGVIALIGFGHIYAQLPILPPSQLYCTSSGVHTKGLPAGTRIAATRGGSTEYEPTETGEPPRFGVSAEIRCKFDELDSSAVTRMTLEPAVASLPMYGMLRLTS